MKIEKTVAKVNDLKDGEMKEVEVGEVGILLICQDGNFYAIGSECTHHNVPLERGSLHGHKVRCPSHQACFDVVTGDMVEPPALDSLACFEVKVEGDDIIVAVPDGATERRIPDMAKRNPNADNRTFAIVGTGGAGNVAAQTLRQDGFEGRVVMVTKEKYLPYDRTDLNKGYLRNGNTEPNMLRTPDFYEDYDIEVLTEHEVIGVDTTAKSVNFRDDSSLKYDKLLLATGGNPRRLNIPGASLENISTLRNPDDANFIASHTQDSSNIVILGASFVSMEAAASLFKKDKSITVVAPESVPFEYSLGKEIGQIYKELHERRGISFKLEAKVKQFAGNGKVEKVILDNGDELEADFVLMGVGVKPATEFLNGFDLNPDGGLPVNNHFQVTEDIYAAGDIASFIDYHTGRNLRIEHWRLAEQHGCVAAHNMVGIESEYTSTPFFWTNQFGVNLRYVGHTKGWDEIIFRNEPVIRNFVAYYIKDDKVVAAAGTGNITQMSAIAELMRIDHMPKPDELRQGSIDMADLLK